MLNTPGTHDKKYVSKAREYEHESTQARQARDLADSPHEQSLSHLFYVFVL